MDIQAKRQSIIKKVKKISDEKTLTYLDGLLNGMEFENSFAPLTREELTNRVLKSEKDLKEGKTKSLRQLKKNVANW